jgi:hypothetical protein
MSKHSSRRNNESVQSFGFPYQWTKLKFQFDFESISIHILNQVMLADNLFKLSLLMSQGLTEEIEPNRFEMEDIWDSKVG